MTVVQNLDQHFINTQLLCPVGMSRLEFVDHQRTGLYVEVRPGNQSHGTYYLRYKDATGKTKHQRIGATTELLLEDARAAGLAFKATFAKRSGQSAMISGGAPAGSVPTDAQGGITLDCFMSGEYFPHVRLHKRSHMRDDQLYRLRIKKKFGHLPLRAITRRAVQQYQGELVAEGLANASVNHHVQLLRHVFNLAVSWEMLDKNALARIPLLPLDNQMNNNLNEEQVAGLVEVLKTDSNRMVCLILLFLLATGARLNEGLQAEWKQVDFDHNLWRIPATNSKSKKLKDLPLNSSALWVIGQLDTKESSRLLFPSPITGEGFTTITRQWYRLRAKAGLPANIRIHDLRHTFASRMVSAQRSLFEVQRLLGHADPRTSQRYAHLSMKAAHEASSAAAFSVA